MTTHHDDGITRAISRTVGGHTRGYVDDIRLHCYHELDIG